MDEYLRPFLVFQWNNQWSRCFRFEIFIALCSIYINIHYFNCYINKNYVQGFILSMFTTCTICFQYLVKFFWQTPWQKGLSIEWTCLFAFVHNAALRHYAIYRDISISNSRNNLHRSLPLRCSPPVTSHWYVESNFVQKKYIISIVRRKKSKEFPSIIKPYFCTQVLGKHVSRYMKMLVLLCQWLTDSALQYIVPQVCS